MHACKPCASCVRPMLRRLVVVKRLLKSSARSEPNVSLLRLLALLSRPLLLVLPVRKRLVRAEPRQAAGDQVTVSGAVAVAVVNAVSVVSAAVAVNAEDRRYTGLT